VEVEIFTKDWFGKLWRPEQKSNGEDNGQVTIIGGSQLFHGAPILSLKAASRIVDMVFFATPEQSVGRVAEGLKSKLLSFIWIPWEEVRDYVQKSDAILIGPGFMRFRSEKTTHGEREHVCDEACMLTSKITYDLLRDFPNKRWVIDAGSLQVARPGWIPKGAVLTPNGKELVALFSEDFPEILDFKPPVSGHLLNPKFQELVQKISEKYECTMVVKGPSSLVCGEGRCVVVNGGNAGLTKGGSGDVQAGLTTALLAKNDPLLSASAAAFMVKAAGDALYERVGTFYNTDDLADKVFSTYSLTIQK